MRNSHPIMFLLALCAVPAVLIQAQSAAPLLDVAGHPRAIALGEAFTAVAGDAAAGWWNPAGLENVLETDIFFMHQSWFADSDIEFIAAARRLPFGTAGLMLAYMHMLPFEINNELGQISHDATAYDVAVLLGFARRFGAFPVGANVKALFRNLDGETAALIGIDLGGSREFSLLKFYKSHLPNSALSLVVKNIATPLYFENAGVNVPVELVLGFRCVPFKGSRHQLLFSCDGSFAFVLKDKPDFWDNLARSLVFAAGMEYGLMQALFLRCGLNVQDTVRLSAGVGLSFNLGGLNLNFDMAYFRKNSENIYSTSLSVRSSMNRSQRVIIERVPVVRDEPRTSRAAPVVIGFLPFVNLTRKPEYDFLCDTIPESVQTVISRNTNILLIDRRKSGSILPSDSRPVTNYAALFENAGIIQIVTGSFVESQRMISVNLKVVDTRSSTVLFGTTVTGTTGKGIFDLIDSISGELNKFYSRPQPESR